MSDLRRLASQCRPVFNALPGLRAAFVFGSMARGEANAASDIDIAVVGQELDVLAVAAALAPLLGHEVDVVELDFDSPLPLLRSFLRDGRRLYERVPCAGAEFLARARTVNELDGPAFDLMMTRFMHRGAAGCGLVIDRNVVTAKLLELDRRVAGSHRCVSRAPRSTRAMRIRWRSPRSTSCSPCSA